MNTQKQQIENGRYDKFTKWARIVHSKQPTGSKNK